MECSCIKDYNLYNKEYVILKTNAKFFVHLVGLQIILILISYFSRGL